MKQDNIKAGHKYVNQYGYEVTVSKIVPETIKRVYFNDCYVSDLESFAECMVEDLGEADV
jgi:hypothetical protein